MKATWRLWFVVAAVLIAVGGAHHPGGTMEEMLAHPDWYFSHVLVLGGFVAMLLALVNIRQLLPPAPALARAMWWVLLGVSVQAVEMAIHTAAAVDLANLRAGRMTPVLTTHLTMALAAYPFYGATMIAFIFAAARAGVVGSHYYGWLGMLGALGHGLAVPLTMAGVEGARVLFPMIVLVAAWMVLAAVTPAPRLAGAAGGYRAAAEEGAGLR